MKHYLHNIAYASLFIFSLTSVAYAADTTRVNLGMTARFAVLAATGVSNSPTSLIVGDVGVSAAGNSALTGFNISGTKEVSGYLFAADDPTGSALATLQQAKNDLTTAYNDAANRALSVTISGNIGGQTLPPGVYRGAGPIEISSGVLTLDGHGDTNAVWIFQIPGTFTVTSNRTVVLTGGAHAQNIFWQIGDTATFGTGIIFNGTVLAKQSIVLGPATKLNGRALSLNGSVSLTYNDVEIPDEASAIPGYTAVSAPASVAASPVATTQSTGSADQLTALLAQLSDLQKQVTAQSTGSAKPAAATPAAKTGVVNETKALQMFLNTHGFQIAASGAGSPGKETTTFGAATKKKLCAFQVNAGLVSSSKSASCGVYGPKTKNKIKELNG